MMVKFIFGHRNPDTDSIVSSIVYATFLGKQNAKAVSLGEINNETKFVLDKFKIKYPEIRNSLPKESKIFLLDHNEKAQSINGIEDLKIEGIIDHHRFDLRIEYLGLSNMQILLLKEWQIKQWQLKPKIARKPGLELHCYVLC